MVLIACHCVPYGCFVCFTCFCSSPCNCCLVLITSNGLLKKPAQVAAVPPIKKSITLEFVFESLKKIMTQTIKHKPWENKWAKVKQTTLLTTTHNRILPQNFIKLCHFCLTFALFFEVRVCVFSFYAAHFSTQIFCIIIFLIDSITLTNFNSYTHARASTNSRSCVVFFGYTARWML